MMTVRWSIEYKKIKQRIETFSVLSATPDSNDKYKHTIWT